MAARDVVQHYLIVVIQQRAQAVGACDHIPPAVEPEAFLKGAVQRHITLPVNPADVAVNGQRLWVHSAVGFRFVAD